MNAKKRMEATLAALNFDFRQFTLERFVRHVERHIGREIIFIPWQMPPGLFGAWISDADEPYEFIFYDEDAPLLHQVHIKLHELAHVVCGHPTRSIQADQMTKMVSGEIEDTAIFQVARLRSTNQAAMEDEAEALAALIQQRVIQHERQAELARTTASNERIAQYIEQMGMS